MIETLCVGCPTPCPLPADVVDAAIASRPPTTFDCDDDPAIVGAGIPRPGVPCACGNPRVIVPRTRPPHSGAHAR